VILSIFYGFPATLIVAILLYCCAFTVFERSRKTAFACEKEIDMV